MSDEYDSWSRYEDAKAFKNKLAEIDQLKDRIERLETALEHTMECFLSAKAALKECVIERDEARKELEVKNETVVI